MNEVLRVGLAGLGTVGSAVFRLLNENAEKLAHQCGRPIQCVAVSARNKQRNPALKLDSVIWYDDPVLLAQSDDIDVFVELMGGEEGVARSAVESALKKGHHVITANKALLAHHGVALARLAESKGVSLNFEAAIAGGIPVVKILREALSVNNISHIYGILNGTCNYILTRMEEKELSFAQCLKEAQQLGYAEADAAFDIEGNDTAHKLALLTSLAFGTILAIDEIYCEGICNISLADIKAAKELGYKIKLLGIATRTAKGVEQRVHPTMVPQSSILAQIGDIANAIVIKTDLLGELLLSGPGAGGDATASAILSDLSDLARACTQFQHSPVFSIGVNDLQQNHLQSSQKETMRTHVGCYYIRLIVEDRIGVFAAVAQRMAQNNISLESIVQRSAHETGLKGCKTIILITHQTTESAISEVLELILQDGHLQDKPQMIRIER